jgi:putative membrane protein
MNRMTMFTAVVALGGGFCLADFSFAADEQKGSGDKEFAKKASAAGLAEVNLSTLAMTRGHNAAVKGFAQHMVADHTKANRELLMLANKQNLTLAKTMDEKHMKMFEKLAKLDGADFDRAYMDGMVKDHEEAVKLFEKQSKEGHDEALKSWAGEKLPILKKHLQMARDVTKKEK